MYVNTNIAFLKIVYIKSDVIKGYFTDGENIRSLMLIHRRNFFVKYLVHI